VGARLLGPERPSSDQGRIELSGAVFYDAPRSNPAARHRVGGGRTL